MSEEIPVFSIIIVNYNSGDLLQKCVASIKESIDGRIEIIVYDNASEDGSVQNVLSRFPEDPSLKIIYGSKNLGFAKANNLAVQHAKGKFFHFLNPDTLVNPHLVADYHVIAKEESNCVYVTSLVDEDGRLLKTSHLIPKLQNYFLRIFRKRKAGYWSIGASLILRRDLFEKVGGWPEEYFIYAEDLDFFYSLFRKDIPVRYLDTRIMHVGKGTTRNIWTESQRALEVELSFRKFYRKQGFSIEYFLVRPILLCYILFNEPREFNLSFKTFLRASFTRIR